MDVLIFGTKYSSCGLRKKLMNIKQKVQEPILIIPGQIKNAFPESLVVFSWLQKKDNRTSDSLLQYVRSISVDICRGKTENPLINRISHYVRIDTKHRAIIVGEINKILNNNLKKSA